MDFVVDELSSDKTRGIGGHQRKKDESTCTFLPNTTFACMCTIDVYSHKTKNLAAFEEATNRLLMRQIIQLLQE